MQNCEYWVVWWINFGYKNERYVYGRLVVVGLRALWPFYGLKLEVWLGLELGPKWVDNWGIVRTELKIRCFQPWKFWHFVKIADWLKQRNETLKSKTISLAHWGWNWWCCCCFLFFLFFLFFLSYLCVHVWPWYLFASRQQTKPTMVRTTIQDPQRDHWALIQLWAFRHNKIGKVTLWLL